VKIINKRGLTIVKKINGGQKIGKKLSLQMKAGFVQKLFI
jgi:hypothetical protein